MKVIKLFSQIRPAGKSASPRASLSREDRDRGELSAGSADVRQLREILEQTPEIRLEKVQALKEQIERSEYQIEYQKVAEKLLQSWLSDY